MATNLQENIYEQIDERVENIYEKPYVDINSTNTEPKYENQGAREEPIYSSVNQPSPDYMNTRVSTEEEEAQLSPSSERGEQMESELMVASLQNGDGYGSGRSSSLEGIGDPCYEEPSLVHEDLLMAYSLPEDESPEPEEVVDYSLKTVENSEVQQETTEDPDPSQPGIALFVKVRAVVGLFGAAFMTTAKSNRNFILFIF